MVAYLVRRILLAVVTIFAISFISYIIIQMPEGDYVDWYIIAAEVEGDINGFRLNDGGKFSDAMMETLREEFGLNDPLVVQYWKWISGIVFKADFGYHFYGGIRTEVKQIIIETLPPTVLLSVFTVTITWLLAIPIGVYSAMRHNTIGDFTFTFLGFTGLAVPDFLLALLMMYLLFAWFDMSVGGLFSGDYELAPWSFGRVVDLMKHLFVPVVVLGTSGTAGLIRIMRNNLLDELSKPYVVTARAKGLSNWKAVVKYPMRVAINPFVSGIGSMLPTLIGGSLIVSVVLSLPTLGPVLLYAIRQEDTGLAGSIVLMMGVMTVVGVLISDILLVVVDPRIKLAGGPS